MLQYPSDYLLIVISLVWSWRLLVQKEHTVDSHLFADVSMESYSEPFAENLSIHTFFLHHIFYWKLEYLRAVLHDML